MKKISFGKYRSKEADKEWNRYTDTICISIFDGREPKEKLLEWFDSESNKKWLYAELNGFKELFIPIGVGEYTKLTHTKDKEAEFFLPGIRGKKHKIPGLKEGKYHIGGRYALNMDLFIKIFLLYLKKKKQHDVLNNRPGFRKNVLVKNRVPFVINLNSKIPKDHIEGMKHFFVKHKIFSHIPEEDKKNLRRKLTSICIFDIFETMLMFLYLAYKEPEVFKFFSRKNNLVNKDLEERSKVKLSKKLQDTLIKAFNTNKFQDDKELFKAFEVFEQYNLVREFCKGLKVSKDLIKHK